MNQHFAEFYHKGTTGKTIPACGTDTHLPIDGRFGLVRAKYTAVLHMESLAKNRIQDYTGFALYRVRGRRTGNEHPYYTYGQVAS